MNLKDSIKCDINVQTAVLKICLIENFAFVGYFERFYLWNKSFVNIVKNTLSNALENNFDSKLLKIEFNVT
jgi:hypothetical protein